MDQDAAEAMALEISSTSGPRSFFDSIMAHALSTRDRPMNVTENMIPVFINNAKHVIALVLSKIATEPATSSVGGNTSTGGDTSAACVSVDMIVSDAISLLMFRQLVAMVTKKTPRYVYIDVFGVIRTMLACMFTNAEISKCSDEICTYTESVVYALESAYNAITCIHYCVDKRSEMRMEIRQTIFGVLDKWRADDSNRLMITTYAGQQRMSLTRRGEDTSAPMPACISAERMPNMPPNIVVIIVRDIVKNYSTGINLDLTFSIPSADEIQNFCQANPMAQ